MEVTLGAELREAPPDLEATRKPDEAAEDNEDEMDDAARPAAVEALNAEGAPDGISLWLYYPDLTHSPSVDGSDRGSRSGTSSGVAGVRVRRADGMDDRGGNRRLGLLVLLLGVERGRGQELPASTRFYFP